MSTSPHRHVAVQWAGSPPSELAHRSLIAAGVDELVPESIPGSRGPLVRWEESVEDEHSRAQVWRSGSWSRLASEPATADALRQAGSTFTVVTTGDEESRVRQCRRLLLRELAGSVSFRHPSGRLLGSDELPLGDEISLGTTALKAEDIIAFAELWDPLDMHLDPQWAEETPMGGLCASGMHLMSIAQRLMSLEFLSQVAVVAGRGLRDLRLLRPGRPGDELETLVCVQDVTQRPNGRDLATTTVSMRANGHPVLRYTGESVILRSTALQTPAV